MIANLAVVRCRSDGLGQHIHCRFDAASSNHHPAIGISNFGAVRRGFMRLFGQIKGRRIAFAIFKNRQIIQEYWRMRLQPQQLFIQGDCFVAARCVCVTLGQRCLECQILRVFSDNLRQPLERAFGIVGGDRSLVPLDSNVGGDHQTEGLGVMLGGNCLVALRRREVTAQTEGASFVRLHLGQQFEFILRLREVPFQDRYRTQPRQGIGISGLSRIGQTEPLVGGVDVPLRQRDEARQQFDPGISLINAARTLSDGLRLVQLTSLQQHTTIAQQHRLAVGRDTLQFFADRRRFVQLPLTRVERHQSESGLEQAAIQATRFFEFRHCRIPILVEQGEAATQGMVEGLVAFLFTGRQWFERFRGSIELAFIDFEQHEITPAEAEPGCRSALESVARCSDITLAAQRQAERVGNKRIVGTSLVGRRQRCNRRVEVALLKLGECQHHLGGRALITRTNLGFQLFDGGIGLACADPCQQQGGLQFLILRIEIGGFLQHVDAIVEATGVVQQTAFERDHAGIGIHRRTEFVEGLNRLFGLVQTRQDGRQQLLGRQIVSMIALKYGQQICCLLQVAAAVGE